MPAPAVAAPEAQPNPVPLPAAVLAMVDGTEVDLSDHATLKGLEADGEAKDFTLSQLEQLQAQVAAHIKALKAPGGVPEI